MLIFQINLHDKQKNNSEKLTKIKTIKDFIIHKE